MQFYSQCQEDIILYTKYFCRYRLEDQKYFLEAGAMDGHLWSNTKFFEDSLGWKGILIEANPFQMPYIATNRPNCIIVNALMSDSKSPLEFIISNNPAVCSVKDTTPQSIKDAYYQPNCIRSIKMIPTRLDEIINKSGISQIDFISLDVEGHELQVLKSFDFKTSQVKVVSWLIEMLNEETKNQEVFEFMEENGYKAMEKVAHNHFFIHRDYLKYFEFSTL